MEKKCIKANPVSLLNKVENGTEFALVEQNNGPSHKPEFLTSGRVHGQKFDIGSSEKTTKHEADGEALKSSKQLFKIDNINNNNEEKLNSDETVRTDIKKEIQTKVTSVLSQLQNGEWCEQTGTSDDPIFTVFFEIDGQKCYGRGSTKAKAKFEATRKALKKIPLNKLRLNGKSCIEEIQKDPVAMLNEVRNGLEYILTEQSGPPDNPVFTISVDVDGQKYYGSGNSKKSAMWNAANKVLHTLNQMSVNKGELNAENYKLPYVQNVEKHRVTALNELKKIHELKNKEQSVEVDNRKYYGTGSSKQTAKYTEVLEALKQHSINELESSAKSYKMPQGGLFQKNPVQVLNELKNDIEYILVEQGGPSHNPVFKLCVEVDGQKYYGTGNSKQTAKFNAANEALESLKQNPMNISQSNVKSYIMPQGGIFQKNPVQVLNELKNDIVYILVEQGGPPHNPVFKFCVEVDGQKYYGTGNSKQTAKFNTANEALEALKQNPMNISQSNKSYIMPQEGIFQKNPVQVLNELKNDIEYILVEQGGPPHNPVFKFCVEVDGQKYYGTGNSKQIAKFNTANEALEALKQNHVNKLQSNVKSYIMSQGEILQKNPVQVLNELKNDIEYSLVEQIGPPHNPVFKFCIKVDGQKYYGSGSSKQIAKRKAANEVLKSINPPHYKQNYLVRSSLDKLNQFYPRNNFGLVQNETFIGSEQN